MEPATTSKRSKDETRKHMEGTIHSGRESGQGHLQAERQRRQDHGLHINKQTNKQTRFFSLSLSLSLPILVTVIESVCVCMYVQIYLCSFIAKIWSE